ncbi:tail fiber protein [Nostoc sp. UHCC 0302]|uniref:phage tail protein n=1 Tax=Nostoc sp. UHCC 0302 TaxID=3134896 RepID=UPI00311CA796
MFGEGELSTIINNLRQELLQEIAELETEIAALTTKVNTVEVNLRDLVSNLNSLSQQIQGLNASKANINSPTFTGIPKAPQPLASSNDDQIATTAFVKSFALPIGVVLPYGGDNPPDDSFMLAIGQAVSRTTYPVLFSRFGTRYGVGDGSTTFNLPNLSYRVPIGSGQSSTKQYNLGETGGEEKHTQSVSEMPGHSHTATQAAHTHNVSAQPHYHNLNGYAYDNNAGEDGDGSGSAYGVPPGGERTQNANVVINEVSQAPAISVANSGGGQAMNVMQPYLVVNFIVKVK